MNTLKRCVAGTLLALALIPSLASCGSPSEIEAADLTRAEISEAGESKDVHQVKKEVVEKTGAICPATLETAGFVKWFACTKDGMNVQVGAYSDTDKILDFIKDAESQAQNENINHSMVIGPDWYVSVFDDNNNNGEGGKNGESDASRKTVDDAAKATGGTVITFGG